MTRWHDPLANLIDGSGTALRRASRPRGPWKGLRSRSGAAPLGWAPRRIARDRRGVAVLEMAAVAPFLLLMLMVFADFGRAISQNMDMSNAVRAGAQHAVTAPEATAEIEATIRSALPSDLTAATVTITCYCGALPAGNTAKPAVAVCTAACPATDARMMTLRTEAAFRPYNFVAGSTIASALNFNKVSGDVTIRFR